MRKRVSALPAVSIFCGLLASCGEPINDAVYRRNGQVWCLLFNKKLAEDNRIGDIYELVRSGKWTIDEMNRCCTNVSHDLNGDSIKIPDIKKVPAGDNGMTNRDVLRNVFRDGRALFIGGVLSYIEYFRDMNDEFGIIPLPNTTRCRPNTAPSPTPRERFS